MIHSKCLFIIFPLLLFMVSGCSDNASDITKPPFSVTQPEYKDSSKDSRCVLGGVYFNFYNRGECSVAYIETRMNVYDRKTRKTAFTGYGTIESGSSVKIRKNETRQLCVSLDQYITVKALEGYYIDQFYISRIEFEDGTVWEDNFGLYAVSSKE